MRREEFGLVDKIMEESMVLERTRWIKRIEIAKETIQSLQTYKLYVGDTKKVDLEDVLKILDRIAEVKDGSNK